MSQKNKFPETLEETQKLSEVLEKRLKHQVCVTSFMNILYIRVFYQGVIKSLELQEGHIYKLKIPLVEFCVKNLRLV